MKLVNFNEFIDGYGWSDAVKHKLRSMVLREDLKYLVAWDNSGKLSASAYTGKPLDWPDNIVAVWAKDGDDPFVEVKSKTMRAVDLVMNEGQTAYAAAKAVGINPSAVHRALKRREEKLICPCCNQVVQDGFFINREVLTDQAVN
jgi:hypothetical protein